MSGLSEKKINILIIPHYWRKIKINISISNHCNLLKNLTFLFGQVFLCFCRETMYKQPQWKTLIDCMFQCPHPAEMGKI